MKCPKCQGRARVIETRPLHTGIVKRRYRCLDCLALTWTYEVPEATYSRFQSFIRKILPHI